MATLFTGQTPTGADNSDGAPGITTATSIRFAQAGSVPAIRFYATSTVSGTYAVALWKVDSSDPGGTGTLLASKTLSGPPIGGSWNSITLDTPVSVLADNNLYRAAVFSGAGRYVSTSGFFSSGPLTNGDLTAPQHNSDPVGLGTMLQGSFAINAALTYPSSGNGTSYFVDVDFTPASGGGDIALSPTGISIPVSLGSPSQDFSTTLSPSGLSIPLSLGSPLISISGEPPVTEVKPNGWRGLQGILRSARAEYEQERSREPVACPNDGEPLRVSVTGEKYCPYDGWKPGRGAS